jgi:hypothetical protein
MSYYAYIENGIVQQVNAIDDDYFESNRETRYTGTWIQTSYNTRGGVHFQPDSNIPSQDQSKALRKNYAGIGFIYDENLDAFYEPQPYPSWILNTESCLWEAPVSYPIDGKPYKWNEAIQDWELD